ncbi:uncharacterized protein LOC131994950 isoform X1 [Stomoxys calcitrans]|uniref:uncharacterized protein LOC131994721 n=2 Tax=Stomoxys calcitrans TaxID=35570 RepID=UPI0027E2A160|nr:uncharacterized protein LOC131994254 isoform X1 [Stomoxys calcitrans]XP_059216886.1 uncharacterized protein LOC131994254 isoform X1 [Stomoxys calcitrans]XP_059217549.1 uncharacterized protein LOC131994721 [Stomoxys calcitrans]XP_059218190.1 uncharacterized protein LOC131994950 isoform X1 [Stomoxys calcitrans]XP_059218192.1 uncharacterized protein LOC131994950 isoform X1 [Stomoxys calcitrans]XP_059218195.1 uncharacterized protein LOC131994950 isoform X1 [Stomoxys calcitrans]
MNNNNKSSQKCKVCQDRHHLRFCLIFNKMTVLERVKVAKEKGYCFNCLCGSHTREWCRSRNACAVCNRNHHTKLHVDGTNEPKKQAHCNKPYSYQKQSSHEFLSSRTQSKTHKANSSHQKPKSQAEGYQIRQRLGGRSKKHVFMPTALARAITIVGANKTRILLNSGATETVILKSFVKNNQFQTTKRNDKEYCTVNLQSFHDSAVKIQIHGLVQSKFTSPLPEKVQDRILENTYSHLPDLADPHFYHPVNIDIMVGNDELAKVLKAGLIQTASHMPIAQSTVFGWVISGARYY